MAVVDAFGTLTGTANAGVTAYFRATGCTELTIADVLPILSKITTYADEYVIGEMKIWDSGSEGASPNNCAMVRVIVYDDGWMCAWFDKESQNQMAGGVTAGYVSSVILSGFSTNIQYSNQWNGYLLKVINSNGAGADDPECPDGTIFCIRSTDYINSRVTVYSDLSDTDYHFNTGNTYDVEIYPSNGNLVWYGHTSSSSGNPSNMANRLYRAIYEMWSVLRYSSNATNATDTAVTKAFLDDGGVFTDETTDFNSAAANDVQLMPATEVVDDAFYYGSANKFRGLNLNIGTAGVGNTIVWEYWDGSAWSSLSVTDATSGFTVLGTNTVTFTPYIDWAKTTVNSSEQYWIRSRVSVAAFTTQPLLTQGWVIVPDNTTYLDTNLGMYSFEDTSANYCLICGRSGTLPYRSHSYYYYYNTILPTKVIYSHSFNYGYSGSITISSKRFYINGKTILVDDTANRNSNGFIILNIEDIDVAVASQNVFHHHGYSYATGTGKYSFATVLIVS